MIKKQITVTIPQTADTLPAALLVQLASRYESNIYIECDSKKINAKSIMGMMSLPLCKGERVTLLADGSDEKNAEEEIEAYLTGRASH